MHADVTYLCLACKISVQLPKEMQDFEKYL